MEQEPPTIRADSPKKADASGANGALGHGVATTVASEPTRQRRRRVSQPTVPIPDAPDVVSDSSQPADVLPESTPPRPRRRPRTKVVSAPEPATPDTGEKPPERNGLVVAPDSVPTAIDDNAATEAIIQELLAPTASQNDEPPGASQTTREYPELEDAIVEPAAERVDPHAPRPSISADTPVGVLDVPYTPPGTLPQDTSVSTAPVFADPTVADAAPITLDMSPPAPPAPPSMADTTSPPPPPPPSDGEEEEEGASMTIIEHLEELRMRLVWTLGAIAIGSFIGWFLTPTVIEHAKVPLLGKADFITLTVFGAFVLNIKMAFFLGVCISMPMTLYQVWSFIAPGLTRNEKRYARPFVALGSVLFIAGAAVGYFIFPLGVSFALTFNTGLQIKPTIEANGYITFIGTIMVLFGITFELPVFMVFLSLIGLLSSRVLSQRRRLAFVVIFIVSTLITPGADPVSPVVLGVMLCGLYELGIWLTRAVGR